MPSEILTPFEIVVLIICFLIFVLLLVAEALRKLKLRRFAGRIEAIVEWIKDNVRP